MADALLLELLNALSHDLRNPLAVIVTNLEFARRLQERGEIEGELADAVIDAAAACDILRRIVGNLDVLVKGKELAASMHELELAALVEEAARRCRTRAERAGISILTSLPAVRHRAMVDRSLFVLALENLIDDGLQHAPNGSTVRVALEIDVEGELGRVHVRDQGKAIPAELRDLAVSGKGNTTEGRVDGTRYGRGLALMSARAAALATGAQLEISADADSSVMTITVPLVTPSE
jgi:K+-sensing histidine kinase KdpD